MSLEKILKKIIDDAKAEADKVILESRKKADEIKKEAEKDAAELAEALVAEAERQGHLEASRIVTQARLETKIGILSKKKELARDVLEKAFMREGLEKRGLKRIIVTKEGEKEEAFYASGIKEELQSKLESEIIEALGL